MMVQELMCDEVKSCRPEQTLEDAAETMLDYDCGCVPVVEADDTLKGIITDRDICMAGYFQNKAPADILIRHVMTKDVLACHAEADVREVEALMRRFQLRRIPVTDSVGRLVGIVSLTDLAQEAERELRVEAPTVSLADVALTLGAVCRPRRSFEYATV
jgi:CBS domain-containing protein